MRGWEMDEERIKTILEKENLIGQGAQEEEGEGNGEKGECINQDAKGGSVRGKKRRVELEIVNLV
jgi:hypothetical protein